jgi:hypothetical protein
MLERAGARSECAARGCGHDPAGLARCSLMAAAQSAGQALTSTPSAAPLSRPRGVVADARRRPGLTAAITPDRRRRASPGTGRPGPACTEHRTAGPSCDAGSSPTAAPGGTAPWRPAAGQTNRVAAIIQTESAGPFRCNRVRKAQWCRSSRKSRRQGSLDEVASFGAGAVAPAYFAVANKYVVILATIDA